MPSVNTKRKVPNSQRSALGTVNRCKLNVLTFPTSFRDVDSRAALHRLDGELNVSRLASRARRCALALLNCSSNATADLELGNVHGVGVQRAVWSRQEVSANNVIVMINPGYQMQLRVE